MANSELFYPNTYTLYANEVVVESDIKTDNLLVQGDLTVDGSTGLHAVTTNNITATGNISATGTLTINGASSLQAVSTANITSTGNISATGSLSGASASISGQVSAGSLSVVTPIGHATGATSQTVTADSNYYPVTIFNTSAPGFLTGGVTFPSTSYFVAPRAGKYNLNACLRLSSAGTGEVTIVIQINETAYGQFLVSSLDNNTTYPTFSQMITLATNDQVRLAVNNGTGSDLTITGGFFIPPSAGSSWFQIFYVGN